MKTIKGITFYVTKLDEFIAADAAADRTTYYDINGDAYDIMTKALKLRAENKNRVIINAYYDEYGTRVIVTKKYTSLTALEKLYGFCLDHNGKMADIGSCSTSVELNPRCAARAKNPDCICYYCYAASMAKQYSDLSKKLARNTAFYCNGIIPVEKLPLINPALFPFFRFESFGDIQNTTQVINYINIARYNPSIAFAWWTKNPDIIASALEEYNEVMPINVNVIYSSPKVNAQVDAAALKARYPFITAIFTVYNAAYAIEHNIDINCGARDCFKCNVCYRTHDRNGVIIVNEIVKDEQKEYYAAVAA